MKHAAPFDTSWIKAWAWRHSINIAVLSVLASATFYLVCRAGRTMGYETNSRDARETRAWQMHTIFAIGVGLAFWFFKAPDPRFAWSLFAILSTMFLTSALLERPTRPSVAEPFLRKAGAISLAALAFLSLARFNDPIPSKLGLPMPLMAKEEIGAGLAISRPLSGDQCWNAFPCSPASVGGMKAVRDSGRLEFRRDESGP